MVSFKVFSANPNATNNLFHYIVAMIVIDTLENGAVTVTCSAQDVLDMRWIVTGFPIAESVNFYTILRSGRNTVPIVEG